MYKYILLFLAFVLAGCSHYPMGFSEEEWERFSIEQQASYRQKEYEIKSRERIEREKEYTKQQQLQLAYAQKEKERIEKLYQNGVIGDIIIVNINNGFIKDGKMYYRIEPVSTVLARGERKEINIKINRSKSSYYTKKIYIEYLQQANGVIIYLQNPLHSNPNKISLFNNGRWNRGESYKKSYKYSYEEIADWEIRVLYHDRYR